VKNYLANLSSEKLDIYRNLFLISLVSLFCELLIIRWLSTEIRVFAYFKNLPLMAAFLGLGLGFIWTKHKTDYFRWSTIALLFLSGLLIFALTFGLTFLSFVDPSKYMLFGIGYGVNWSKSPEIWVSLRTLLIMLGVFGLTTFAFVGFGQKMGQLFDQLKPIEAYSINVAGALAGTVLFSLLSWLQTSPGVWIFIAGLILLAISRKPAHFALVLLGIFYFFWIGTGIATIAYEPDYVKTVWSPYYRIDVVKSHPPANTGLKDLSWGYALHINYDNFQEILNCSAENLARFPATIQKVMHDSFEIPFQLLPDRSKARVLILGSGNGSDVAAALRCGVDHVDAIEIDPGIVRIGKNLHPEHPYASPKVNLRVMDARTFLQGNNGTYNLILFAYVDSHAAFSSMSSLRMDNYLFTLESFKQAAKHLAPNGLIVVRFLSMADWLWDRHAKALALATGTKPLGYCRNNGNVDVGVLLAGPAINNKTAADFNIGFPERAVNLNSPVPLASDNWPFLFLPKKEIPKVYMLPIFLILFVAFILVGRYFKDGFKSVTNWQMFCLGMGFMLLEVRAMADLSLLFGSTWLVNSAVISGVMVVILMANLLAVKLSIKQLPLLGILLLVSLAATTLVDVSYLAAFGPLLAQVAGVIIYLFPLVFASVIFALLFKNIKSASIGLAFNLIGGLIGICLEYLSMGFGLQALGGVALVIYATILVMQVPACQRLFSEATS